jgi:hypothetical protein
MIRNVRKASSSSNSIAPSMGRAGRDQRRQRRVGEVETTNNGADAQSRTVGQTASLRYLPFRKRSPQNGYRNNS